MATETTNYNLSKAVVDEFYDVLKVNANTDKIDEQMKKNEIAAKKFARFVIGTSFNSQGWAAHNCNYLCDGVADQVEINAAIAALPATGGEIVILDGVYDLKAPIEMNKANITIRGNGKATELKTNWNAIALDGNINISADNCMIKDLYLNSVAIRTYNIGIYIISGSGNTVSNVKTKAYKHGILINAASNTNIITDNICTEGTYGITVSSSNSTIKNNICNANTVGISIRTSNNTVNGNTVENNTNYGIELLDAIQNAVVGNNCYNNKKGICLITSASNTIVGNTCLRGTGLSIDYAADQDTIYVYNGCLNNLISNNNCLGKAINIINPANGNSNINNKWDASDDIKEIRESINTLDAEVDNHKIDGEHQKVNVTNTDDATSLINASIKTAGGLAVAKTAYMGRCILQNASKESQIAIKGLPHPTKGGYIEVHRVVTYIPKVTTGSKLIIPFVSQDSLNIKTLVTIKGFRGDYNSQIHNSFKVEFVVGSLNLLQYLTVLDSKGNYASAAINGMNVEIAFTAAYGSGVYIDLEFLTENVNYSVDIKNISMN